MRLAAEVFITHLQNNLVSLVAHGSAVTGGYVPEGSDIDFVLIVRSDTLSADEQLPFATVAGLQEGLSRIDMAPFRYLQSRVEEQGSPRGGGFVPGAYHVVWGERGVPLATPEGLREAAREGLSRLDPVAIEAQVCHRLLDCGEGRFDREVRYICTDVWPTLRYLLILQSVEPLRVWGMTKTEAIATLSKWGEVGIQAREFHEAVVTHYTTGESVKTGVEVLERGLRFLRSASEQARSVVR